jgi:hypothetical protein
MTIGEDNPPNNERTSVTRRLFNLLFGYDYFLVHRSSDGKKYALALYDALTEKGNELDCFLDVKAPFALRMARNEIRKICVGAYATTP